MKFFRKRKKYRDHEQEPLAAIVNRALRSEGIDPEATAARDWQEDLLTLWHDLVGEPIVSHTRPLKISRGRLTILVDSPAWNQELQTFGGKLLLQAIQKAFPAVKELRFQVGNLEER